MKKKQFYQNIPLILTLLTSIAITSTEVPLWISLFSLVMIAWKYLNEKMNVPKLSTKLTPILGLLIFAIVYIQYKTILGQEESTTVLLGLVSLTILNYETDRDTLFLVLLGFLIVVIKSVFSLDFIWTVPALFSFFGLWYSLLTNTQVSKSKYLMRTTLRSLPGMLVLFVLFPRLVIFQSKQPDRVIVQSGFSEDLNPGRFSAVALQNQMVFRAEFENSRMNTEELYWRGAVLNISKGFIWHKGATERVTSGASEPLDNAIDYKVILEPMNLKNIFVLDSPIKMLKASAPIVELKHASYALANLQTQQVQFEARAAFNLNEVKEDDPTGMQKYLFIPDLPPKTKKFVEEIRNRYANPKDRIEALKKFFQQKGFIYTLNPELYQNNLDEFLFERKKGFCEHFAAAFGTVARGLGVPSRVIIGYQGGSYNSLGNFWKVSQKDAHAWVEVGLNGKWVRVDPTALVTPLRISTGGENYFSLSEDEQILFSKNPEWKKNDSLAGAINQFKAFFENLNYYWTVFLLNYDLQAQLEYLRQFQGSWLVGSFFILLFTLFLLYNRKKRKISTFKRHEFYDFFIKIESWATKKGISVSPQQTPLQVLRAIGVKFPQFKEVIDEIANEYQLVVYQEKQPNKDLKSLRKSWKSIAYKMV
jgi:protein-glutamine gamma-glutamyltransferase